MTGKERKSEEKRENKTEMRREKEGEIYTRREGDKGSSDAKKLIKKNRTKTWWGRREVGQGSMKEKRDEI